ncbi:MAG TPA: GNAT family N-acetyltransferase [Anaerolinea sp.]|nr:GNAT family N-acetyltransferase [Anaerolinea sp.]
MLPDTLITERLVVRPFLRDDLREIHRILDQSFGAGSLTADPQALAARQSWLEWSMLNSEWFPRMQQVTYGDRAVALQENGKLIGSVGYVPFAGPFYRIPGMGGSPDFNSLELGLFWVIDEPFRGNGYAAEAGRAMLEAAFFHLGIPRVIATTEFDNAASQAVMRKLGMRVERNPTGEPEWLQVVGWADNPGWGQS